jgi:molybdopterin-guanine dinucleotide biosynthesis protein A
MGSDKGLLPFPDDPLAVVLARRFAPLVDNVVIVARETEPYRPYGITVVGDLFKGRGSLVGLASALANSAGEYTFVVACDMPFVTVGVAESLFAAAWGHAAAIPINEGRWDPLCSVYRRDLLPVLSDAFARGIMRIREALTGQDLQLVPAESLPGNPAVTFANVNTAEEYRAALALVAPPANP